MNKNNQILPFHIVYDEYKEKELEAKDIIITSNELYEISKDINILVKSQTIPINNILNSTDNVLNSTIIATNNINVTSKIITNKRWCCIILIILILIIISGGILYKLI